MALMTPRLPRRRRRRQPRRTSSAAPRAPARSSSSTSASPTSTRPGRIAGARHIELERVASQAPTIDSDRPVVFYCRLGARSGMAANAFRRAGWDAYSMDGGLEAWDRAGHPAGAQGRACRGSLGRCSRSRCSRSPRRAARRRGADARAGRPSFDVARSTPPRRRATRRRLFVVERGGRVRLVRNGTKRPRRRSSTSRPGRRPTASAGCCRSPSPPDYEALRALLRLHGRRGARAARCRCASTAARRATPTRRPGPGRIVWSTPHAEASNHNGGQVAFGPGRDAVVRDRRRRRRQRPVQPRARPRAATLGKLLRIDPHPGNGGGYTIPADNPFGTAVWAYGLRNPFRFSFDPRHGRPLHRRRRPGRARGDRPGRRYVRGPRAGRRLRLVVPRGRRSPGRRPAARTRATCAPTCDYDAAPAPRAVTGGYVVRDPGLPTLLRPLRLRGHLRGRSCSSFVPGAARATDDQRRRAAAARPARLLRRGRLRPRLRDLAQRHRRAHPGRRARPVRPAPRSAAAARHRRPAARAERPSVPDRTSPRVRIARRAQGPRRPARDAADQRSPPARRAA